MDAGGGRGDAGVPRPLAGRTCRRRWSHPDLEEEGVGDAGREEEDEAVVMCFQDRCFDVFVLMELVSSSGIAFSDQVGEEGRELDVNGFRGREGSGGGLPSSDRSHCASAGVKTMGLSVHGLTGDAETRGSTKGFSSEGRDLEVSSIGLVMRSRLPTAAGSVLRSGPRACALSLVVDAEWDSDTSGSGRTRERLEGPTLSEGEVPPDLSENASCSDSGERTLGVPIHAPYP